MACMGFETIRKIKHLDYCTCIFSVQSLMRVRVFWTKRLVFLETSKYIIYKNIKKQNTICPFEF